MVLDFRAAVESLVNAINACVEFCDRMSGFRTVAKFYNMVLEKISYKVVSKNED